MSAQSAQEMIDVTAAFVRLYVFLTNYLDRCVDRAKAESFPEHELQAHLASTRASLADILKVNPVVQTKVERECQQILTLGEALLKGGAAKSAALNEVQTARAVLRDKTLALSDLLAVFRAT